MRYAQDTSVPVERSKAEIERLLQKYGASKFASSWAEDRATVAFIMNGRGIRFVLPLPSPNEDRFRFTVYMGHVKKDRPITDESARARWEQACRQSWRALALVIKAKLEAVETKITSFDEEFYAHLILPNGKTIYEETHKQVAIAYQTGKVPALLEFK